MAIFVTAFLTGNSLAASEPEQFEDTLIYLEQNFTDQDTEVVIFVKGTDEGLKTLDVAGPSRKKVLQLHSKKRTLGARELVLESPEPGLDEILKAYPEGEYTFSGQTVSGMKLNGVATLTHNIPQPATVVFPADEADDVNPTEDLVIKWGSVPGAVKYLIEVEREEPEPELTLQGQILPLTTTFTVSKDWLEANGKYQLSIAVVNADGNITWVEQTFSTTP